MGVAEDKKRLVFTIPKDLYDSLAKLAKEDSRSASNLIVKLITDYVKEKGK